MKIRFTTFVAFVLALSAPAIASTVPVPVTLDDVVKKVSSENYQVYENALRVYQAKEAIQVARGNLLPKLNVWNVASVVFDPTSAVGLVEDIAPFLVPGNWFRLSESKLLYQAEKEGYRALWANELMTAKALYVHLLFDQALLSHIESGAKELKDLLILVQSREVLGGIPEGASRDIEIRLLALQEDRRSLEVLILEEQSLLSYMMGLPAETQVVPMPIDLPDFSQLEPLDHTDFEFRALDSSPELRQFDQFIQVAGLIKKEVNYSFLGVSGQSRGAAGGVFDNLPISNGLGFGTAASARIVAAKKEILKTQRKGVSETIRRQLRLLVSRYNLDLENYANLRRRVDLTETTNRQLFERLRLGNDVSMIDLIEASRNHIQADTALFSVKYRFIANEDRLARLIFYGDYSKQPALIEEVKGNEK